jgi:hypothetical protein
VQRNPQELKLWHYWTNIRIKNLLTCESIWRLLWGIRETVELG